MVGSSSCHGERIPQELFAPIIDALLYPVRSPSRHNHKRGLALCSLTCRYWAKRIRPALFRRLTIRTLQDISDLLYILDSRSAVEPNFADCIRELVVEHCPVDGIPWIHHVHSILRRLRDATVSLRIINQADNSQDSSTTSHTSIAMTEIPLAYPRTLPSSILPISQLLLDGLRIRHISDLVRLIYALPTLRHCECRRLLFVDQSCHSLHTRRVLRRNMNLTSVSVSECGDGRLETQIALASDLLAGTKSLGMDLALSGLVFVMNETISLSKRSVIHIEIKGK